VTDHILLRGMVFEGRHGATEEERADAQAIEVDVELEADLRRAGESDDLAQTVDYGEVFEVCRVVVEDHSFRLLEAIAEGIARDVLTRFTAVEAVAVTVRKPGVPIDGVLEHAAVCIERRRGER
jgi:7,8-dihydroneopterin aldolase/epimerase/oxygenase